MLDGLDHGSRQAGRTDSGSVMVDACRGHCVEAQLLLLPHVQNSAYVKQTPDYSCIIKTGTDQLCIRSVAVGGRAVERVVEDRGQRSEQQLPAGHVL